MEKNRLKLGLGVLTVLATPIAVNAVASNDALAAQGWVQSGASWYYLDAQGRAVRNAWIGNYWLGSDGRMVVSSWVDNGRYYVGANGVWDKNAKKETPKPEVKKQGWVKSGSDWYYYENGIVVKNKWAGNYWLGSDGKMVVSSWVDNGRYYVGANGVWDKNAKKETPKPEVKKQGWVKSGSDWYYYENGIVVKNKWAGNYWLGSDGKMVVSSWVDNGRYYVGANGVWDKNAKKETPKPEVKKQGWVKSGSDWYYYENGIVVKNKWAGNYWLGSDGKMAVSSWVDNGRYYVGANGVWDKNAKKEEEKKHGWVKSGNDWYYYDATGALSRNKWAGNYWLGSDGRMATNSWVDNGRYYVGSNGAWVKNAGYGVTYSAYYKVTALYIPVYDANGRILSHVSRDTVLFRDNRSEVNGRIPVQVAGLTGYVNPSQVKAVDSSNTFIPDYVSDGKYVYHRYSQYTKVMVAYHNANMVVGKSYYSADGINFGTFKLDHPFQFSNLNSKTNYSAAEINKLYSLMGVTDSKLAGKGATFKAAEQKYGVNALYLVAHSALESAWGRSNIAKDKNNFFGIAAYDETPYSSATKYDNVDSGIMGAARWIKEKYLHNSGYPANGAYLGNKAGGMNVNYATAPYWGESIASIMFNANEKLGRKDG